MRTRFVATEGRIEAMALYAGESVGEIASIESAATGLTRIVEEARALLDAGRQPRWTPRLWGGSYRTGVGVNGRPRSARRRAARRSPMGAYLLWLYVGTRPA